MQLLSRLCPGRFAWTHDLATLAPALAEHAGDRRVTPIIQLTGQGFVLRYRRGLLLTGLLIITPGNRRQLWSSRAVNRRLSALLVRDHEELGDHSDRSRELAPDVGGND